MKVAFHIDQLWFKAPGGIGTYVTQLGPALTSEDPALELVPFRSSFPTDHRVESFGSHDAVVLPWRIRTLYPSWDLLGRPALPAHWPMPTSCTRRTPPPCRRSTTINGSW